MIPSHELQSNNNKMLLLKFTDYPRYSAVIIGNHMIFRAIWDKSALVNFSKTQPNCTSPGSGNVMGQSLDKKKQRLVWTRKNNFN